MADEVNVPPPPDPAAAPKKKMNKLVLIGGAVGGLAVIQAAVLFFIFKGSGAGPTPAQGADSHAIEGATAAQAEEGADAAAGHGQDAHAKKEPAKEHGKKEAKEDAHAKKDEGHGEKKAESGHGKASSGHGEDPAGDEPPPAIVELGIAKSFKVTNNKSGRLYVYDFDIAVTVAGKNKSRAEKLIKERGNEIADAISQVVRGADQKTLNEDDLRTLRQHILRGLADVADDEQLFQKVLIPRCVPLRAD